MMFSLKASLSINQFNLYLDQNEVHPHPRFSCYLLFPGKQLKPSSNNAIIMQLQKCLVNRSCTVSRSQAMLWSISLYYPTNSEQKFNNRCTNNHHDHNNQETSSSRRIKCKYTDKIKKVYLKKKSVCLRSF